MYRTVGGGFAAASTMIQTVFDAMWCAFGLVSSTVILINTYSHVSLVLYEDL